MSQKEEKGNTGRKLLLSKAVTSWSSKTLGTYTTGRGHMSSASGLQVDQSLQDTAHLGFTEEALAGPKALSSEELSFKCKF